MMPTVLGASERVLTHAVSGHLVHNSQIFSRDGRYIVFDSRNDETRLATSTRIGMVEIATGKETVLYETSRASAYGPGVGAATFNPVTDQVVFIHGLDNASAETPYAPARRSAALVDIARPGRMSRLDARDVTPPFTPGALRGGTHAHHWSRDGKRLSFTYNDAVTLSGLAPPDDLRTIGVISLDRGVAVGEARPGEEFSGTGFTVLVVPVKPDPSPGSDELLRACEEAWAGNRAIAFIGTVVASDGQKITEVFLAELPEDLSLPGLSGALEGGLTSLPAPPAGVVIRRLTRTEDSPRPGLQGPRHWLRPSPDGKTIAFLDEDGKGVVQIFGVASGGGPIRQISQLEKSVDCSFSWSPDGRSLGCSAGRRIALIDAAAGSAEFLTPAMGEGRAPRHGVTFSPDGKSLAYNRLLPGSGGRSFLQICLVELPSRRE